MYKATKEVNKNPCQVNMSAIDGMKWGGTESMKEVLLQTGSSEKNSDSNKKASAMSMSEKREVEADCITYTNALGQERIQHFQQAGKGPVWQRLQTREKAVEDVLREMGRDNPVRPPWKAYQVLLSVTVAIGRFQVEKCQV